MRDAITTIGELAGGFVVAIGFGMFAAPLGVIVGGALLCAFCWLADR